MILAVLLLLTVPATAEAGTLSADRAKRITRRIAVDTAQGYEGWKTRVGGCARKSSRRMICRYTFLREDLFGEFDGWDAKCRANVVIQLRARGAQYTTRADLPVCRSTEPEGSSEDTTDGG
jgi:hypothetical protein